MWKYFKAHQKDEYLDILDKLVHPYNHSIHRKIGMGPADVQNGKPKLFNKMFGEDLAKVRSTQSQPLKQRQILRLSKVK